MQGPQCTWGPWCAQGPQCVWGPWCAQGPQHVQEGAEHGHPAPAGASLLGHVAPAPWQPGMLHRELGNRREAATAGDVPRASHLVTAPAPHSDVPRTACGPVGTFEPLPHPQGEAIFGPLHDPGIIEHHAGEDDPLASHHCLVLWFLHEPRLCHCGQRKGISQGSGCPACWWPCRQCPVLRHGAATELPPAQPHREPPQGSPWSLEVLEGLLGVLDPPKPGSAVPLSPSPVQ